LVAAFGKRAVFFDIDTIEAGQDFPAVLQASLAGCGVVIVLIGREWLHRADPQGRRRLDDPKDFVRQEILYALEHPIRVIPVLVGGATMPAAEDLPLPLRPLAFRNAFEISDHFFQESIRELVHTLKSGANADDHRQFLTRRRFLLSAGAVTALGGAALFAIIKPTAPEKARNNEEHPSDVPKLDVPSNDSIPAVTVRVPEDVSGLPEVVKGPYPVSGVIASNATGPRHPKLLWSARISIGDSWKPLGFAPDGTVYIYDSEHDIISGVARGREQWAYRWKYMWFLRGIAPDGRVWFESTGPADTQYFCFNSRGEGGAVRGVSRLPSGLISGEPPIARFSCEGGKLRPLQGNWSLELDGNCSFLREAAGGSIYVGTDRGTVSYVSSKGTLLSTYAAVSELRDTLLAAGDLIARSESELVSLREGHLRWKSGVPGRPHLADGAGTVYVTYEEGETSVQIGRNVVIGGGASGEVDRKLFPGPSKRMVAALDQNGTMVWRFDTGSHTYEAVGVDPQGQLYLTEGDHQLICLAD
jgi:outer membrane protein assembly factor BamB